MQFKDVGDCVDIVASQPQITERYGAVLADLKRVWVRILGSAAAILVLFEELDGTRTTLCGVGAAVFASDAFVAELKTRPFWIGPELVRRIIRGESPLLSEAQLRAGNSRGALNVVTWETAIRPGFEGHSELKRTLATSFLENLRGFHLQEAIANQTPTAERLQWTLQAGAMLWEPNTSRYVQHADTDPREVLRNPFVLSVPRDIERIRPGTWIGALFEYSPPRCGFSAAEQRLLTAALDGDTDEQLASRLRVSVSTVKKTWMSVYRRMETGLPDVFGRTASAEAEPRERGKEKRRRLLMYLREHPEELRPYSRPRSSSYSARRG